MVHKATANITSVEAETNERARICHRMAQTKTTV